MGGGRLPCGHPAFAWLVQHSSSALTKGLVGKDGRTPYARLFGKEVAEEGLEFGEVLSVEAAPARWPQYPPGGAVADGGVAWPPLG